jgi:tetratricopeptide (TPR) repeat protein
MDDAWNDRLSEYLDDELQGDERAALEAHLSSCLQCRSDLAALRAVIARAGRLSDVPPGRDLWPGVAAGIGAAHPQIARRRELRRFVFTMPQLIAAGLALMVLSGGLVWLARLGGPGTDFPPVGAVIDAPAVRPANFADGAYDEAAADLQRALEAGRATLDKETIRVLEMNLQTIDRAISQCREALASDPANVYLNTYLAEARARKLDLLRRATAIAHGGVS